MKQRILAVDDELHMLKLLERIIGEKTAYQIQTTNNALEVPPLLTRESFDIIITDLKMPGMDGIDLLKHIKEKNIDSEVIIITASVPWRALLRRLPGGLLIISPNRSRKSRLYSPLTAP